MAYIQYEKYKDSGTPWLGRIPKHWGNKRLKSILIERKEKNKPIKTDFILSLCMYRGVIPYSEKGNSGNKAKEDLSAYKLAYPDDIVLNSMNVVAGSVGLSKYFGAVSPVYYMLRTRKEDDNVNYFNDIFQSMAFQKSLFGLGSGILVKKSEKTGKLNTIRMKIPMIKLNDVFLPYPPPNEQIKISNFLAYKLEKIARFITQKKQLIELLEEQKAAIINKAVTKGIKQKAKLKPSGIEWLGDIPENWEVSKLKTITEIISKGTTPSTIGKNMLDKGEVRFLKAENIGFNNMVLESPINFIDDETNSLLKRSQLQANDILFVIAGASIGKVAILPPSCTPSNTNQAVSFIRLKDNSNVKFVWYWLQSEFIKQTMWLEAVQSAQPNLAMGKLSNFPVLLPTIQDQKEIIKFIESESAKIDRTITTIEKELTLVEEYKTALIAEAVTGKIDVRDFKAPSTEEPLEMVEEALNFNKAD